MDMDRIKIVDNENVYGEVRYRIIKDKMVFEKNQKFNILSHGHSVMVIEKEDDYDKIIFYARYENGDIKEGFMSKYVMSSLETMKKVEFFANLTPTFFNKIYTYYI